MVVVDAETRERMAQAARAAWFTASGGYWGASVDAVLALVPQAAPSSQTADWVLKDRDEAHAYLRRLFEHCAPQCTPLPDLLGLCTQIDNYIAGLRAECRPPTPTPDQRLARAVTIGMISDALRAYDNAVGDHVEKMDRAITAALAPKMAVPDAVPPPAPDQRLAAVAAWRSAAVNAIGVAMIDDGIASVHSMLSELLTRVTALERGR